MSSQSTLGLEVLSVARGEDGRGGRCLVCEQTFSQLTNAKRHFRDQHCITPGSTGEDGDQVADAVKFVCNLCGKEFRLKRYRDNHMLTVHKASAFLRKTIAREEPQDVDDQ